MNNSFNRETGGLSEGTLHAPYFAMRIQYRVSTFDDDKSSIIVQTEKELYYEADQLSDKERAETEKFMNTPFNP